MFLLLFSFVQRVKRLKIHNHSNKTINFTFFSKKGCAIVTYRLKALPLHTIISNNTFKVTICDFENEYKYDRHNGKDRKRRTGHKS